MGFASKWEDDRDRYLEGLKEMGVDLPSHYFEVDDSPSPTARVAVKYAEARYNYEFLQLDRKKLFDEIEQFETRTGVILSAEELLEYDKLVDRFREVTENLIRALEREGELLVQLARLQGRLKSPDT